MQALGRCFRLKYNWLEKSPAFHACAKVTNIFLSFSIFHLLCTYLLSSFFSSFADHYLFLGQLSDCFLAWRWQVRSPTIPQLPQHKELFSALSPYHQKLVGESYLGRRRPVYECTDVQVCYWIRTFFSVVLIITNFGKNWMLQLSVMSFDYLEVRHISYFPFILSWILAFLALICLHSFSCTSCLEDICTEWCNCVCDSWQA